ncbi:MAG: hypothetical protein HY736_17925 [Verrucomicrobia bacterium]|nr:hypothetical protein [Verrucomicrobiota bacterium]
MKTQPERAAEWVSRWRALGPVLEPERAAGFATADMAATASAFDGLLQASLHTHPPSPDSGLIGQQRLFRRLRDA